MSESKRGPGRPPRREIGPDGVRLFKDVPADDVQAVEVDEAPADDVQAVEVDEAPVEEVSPKVIIGVSDEVAASFFTDEAPSIVKAVAAIFTDEPVKQVRNLTRESIAVSRGPAVAAKMVQ